MHAQDPRGKPRRTWQPALRLWGLPGQRPTRATSVTGRSQESRPRGRGPITARWTSRRLRRYRALGRANRSQRGDFVRSGTRASLLRLDALPTSKRAHGELNAAAL